MKISCAREAVAADWPRVVSRICICCGEPFACPGLEEQGNPNICIACSSMADLTEEDGESQSCAPAPDSEPKNWPAVQLPQQPMAKHRSRSITR